MVGGEADCPRPIIVGHLVEGGEGAAHGHDEGSEAEDEVVRGGDEAEGVGTEGREEWEAVESVGESEVG